MKSLERRTGIEAEFVGQPGAGMPVYVQRFRGAAVPVQGEHVQFDGTFADRLLRAQPGQFGQEGAVAAQLEAGGEGFFHGMLVQLIKVGAQPLA